MAKLLNFKGWKKGRVKEGVEIPCDGCKVLKVWKEMKAVTVSGERGYEQRWYCWECYRGFEYGRDY